MLTMRAGELRVHACGANRMQGEDAPNWWIWSLGHG